MHETFSLLTFEIIGLKVIEWKGFFIYLFIHLSSQLSLRGSSHLQQLSRTFEKVNANKSYFKKCLDFNVNLFKS